VMEEQDEDAAKKAALMTSSCVSLAGPRYAERHPLRRPPFRYSTAGICVRHRSSIRAAGQHQLRCILAAQNGRLRLIALCRTFTALSLRTGCRSAKRLHPLQLAGLFTAPAGTCPVSQASTSADPALGVWLDAASDDDASGRRSATCSPYCTIGSNDTWPC
jgi:hypothetical protein